MIFDATAEAQMMVSTFRNKVFLIQAQVHGGLGVAFYLLDCRVTDLPETKNPRDSNCDIRFIAVIRS